MGDLFATSEARWVAGLIVAALIARAAWTVRSLTASGRVAATVVGSAIVGAAGWWSGFVMVVFFATSSALSIYASHRSAIGEQIRGKRRDAVQVLANGGVPTLCALVSLIVANPGPWRVALIAGIAGAAADTWATEIGRLANGRTWMITTWREAVPGTSGAISQIGSLGSFAGALLIALAGAGGEALGAFEPGLTGAVLISIVTIAGVVGSATDSLLGATVQARYRCRACGVPTEAPVHRCGTRSTRTGGLRWMTNDTVNALAIATSAGLALILATLA